MKKILIIGSSGGIGTEISKHLANSGHDLVLHYNTHKPSSEFKDFPQYKADITKENEVAEMIKKIIDEQGSIDAVINNAGVSISEISWKTKTENWDKTIGVNLSGPFFISKHLIPHMRDKSFGRIIFISSIVAETGFIGTSAYAASKAGLIGLTKTLSKELANKNITVNAIALGYFNVGMIDDVSDELQQQLKAQIPKGELGDPEELSALIDYIISDKSSYLTGQTLNLNGGLYS